MATTAEQLERAYAAVPDLLAACQAALASDPMRTGKDQITIDESAWQMMRDAIAKATGQRQAPKETYQNP